jgi:hypothetical protein
MANARFEVLPRRRKQLSPGCDSIEIVKDRAARVLALDEPLPNGKKTATLRSYDWGTHTSLLEEY